MASINGVEFQMDALLPAEMAARAQEIGARKAAQDVMTVFVLSVLAGAFIALGALFSTTVAAGTAGVLPYGIIRLLSGLVFSLGLILVVVGGAELFTGNNLIVMAWASRHISTWQLLRNWGIVYLGNFAGALATAAIVFLSRQYTFGGGAVGLAVINTILTQRSQEHYLRLSEHVQWGNPEAVERMNSMAANYTAHGLDGATIAVKQMAGMVQQQAYILSFIDVFLLLTGLFTTLIVCVLAIRKPQSGVGGGGH